MELEYLVSKWKIARSKIDDWSVERKCIIADNFFFFDDDDASVCETGSCDLRANLGGCESNINESECAT